MNAGLDAAIQSNMTTQMVQENMRQIMEQHNNSMFYSKRRRRSSSNDNSSSNEDDEENACSYCLECLGGEGLDDNRNSSSGGWSNAANGNGSAAGPSTGRGSAHVSRSHATTVEGVKQQNKVGSSGKMKQTKLPFVPIATTPASSSHPARFSTTSAPPIRAPPSYEAALEEGLLSPDAENPQQRAYGTIAREPVCHDCHHHCHHHHHHHHDRRKKARAERKRKEKETTQCFEAMFSVIFIILILVAVVAFTANAKPCRDMFGRPC